MSPLGTTPTHSPGKSGSFVRTLAPRKEISNVNAALSDILGPPLSTRLIGIFFCLRAHRREVIEVVTGMDLTSSSDLRFSSDTCIRCCIDWYSVVHMQTHSQMVAGC